VRICYLEVFRNETICFTRHTTDRQNSSKTNEIFRIKAWGKSERVVFLDSIKNLNISDLTIFRHKIGFLLLKAKVYLKNQHSSETPLLAYIKKYSSSLSNKNLGFREKLKK